MPPGPLRNSLEQVAEFAAQARDNLDVAGPLIARIAQPIEVHKVAVNGSSPPLEIFAIAVAATLTLAFVTVLLVAGSLALEREENAFPRLTRGLISPRGLLAEKVLLGDRRRAGGDAADARRPADLRAAANGAASGSGCWRSWPAAAALAAAGAALGAAAREVRAVSLLAFMVTLPIAFLSLVPSGRGRLRDLRRDQGGHRDLPLQAGAAGDDRRARLRRCRGIGVPLLHLAILIAAYGLIARFALRRFAAV